MNNTPHLIDALGEQIAERLNRIEAGVASLVAATGAPDPVAISADAVARMLKVRRGRVYQLHEKGELVGFRVEGSSLRFLVSDVRAYAERMAHGDL